MKTIFIFLILIFISLQSVYSEGKRNVAVYPLSNPTGEKWISNLGQSVTDTVILSLALMGRFDIETPETLPADFEIENLSSIAESNGFDNIIFGDCQITDDGYKVGVSIYDFSKDGITDTSEEEFYSLLDSFDAADNIVDIVVENLSGEKVYFGSLFVKPTRNEQYRTEINGNDVGFGFTGSDKVVTGLHDFQFFQERINGEELIGSEKIEVKLRKSSQIKLNIPWLTDDEALSYRKIRNNIMRNVLNGEPADKSSSLISDAHKLSDNPFFSKYRKAVKEEYSELDDVINSPRISYSSYVHSIEANNFTIIDSVFRDILTKKSKTLEGTELSRKAVMFSSSFHRSYPMCSYDAAITVDGNSDDWKNISSVYNDMKGDQRTENRKLIGSVDLVRYGVAMDRKYLYLMFETAEKKYSSKHRYIVYLRNVNEIRISYYPGGNRSDLTIVPKGNWNNSRKSTAAVKKASGEVIEMAVPLSVITKNINSNTFVVDVDFRIREDKDNGEQMDISKYKAVLPTLYYDLTAE